MKVAVMMLVVAVLGACGEVDEGDAPELSSEESEVLQCGFGCASGSHPVAFSCSPSCAGSCTAVFNQTDCQPDAGSFTSCSLGCPVGFHVTSFQFAARCRTSPASNSNNNQSSCAPNTGSSFFTCGFGCPSPYRPAGTSSNPACQVSPGGSGTQTRCVL